MGRERRPAHGLMVSIAAGTLAQTVGDPGSARRRDARGGTSDGKKEPAGREICGAGGSLHLRASTDATRARLRVQYKWASLKRTAFHTAAEPRGGRDATPTTMLRY